MSTLSVTNLKNAASATNNLVLNPDGSVNISGGTLSPQVGFRNRIINGAMTIDQRNAGASVTVSGNYSIVYGVDRFSTIKNTSGIFSVQRSSVAPAGFTNSFLATVTTADASVATDDFANIAQAIEGFNIADLGWGTANAQTVTLSFWVRSSLTGTYCCTLVNGSGTRSYVSNYTISAANTWEYKTITVPGDTSGTWNTDNTTGIIVRFGLMAGTVWQQNAGFWGAGNVVGSSAQTNWIGTSGATFYITGTQLEKGSTATPFEFRSIGTELGLCQRYYQTISDLLIGGNVNGAGTYYSDMVFPVPMRTSASMTIVGTPTYSNASSYLINSTAADKFRLSLQLAGVGYGFGYAAKLTASAEL